MGADGRTRIEAGQTVTYPVSGADSLQVRRAYLRRGGSRRGHDRRLIARWVVIGVVVLWLVVAGVVLVAAG
jgi:hypothetical protein